MKKQNYNKFTNDVRLTVNSINTLEEKIKFLISFLEETTNTQYKKLRINIMNCKNEQQLEQIMFNMQLMSEGLGLR